MDVNFEDNQDLAVFDPGFDANLLDPNYIVTPSNFDLDFPDSNLNSTFGINNPTDDWSLLKFGGATGSFPSFGSFGSDLGLPEGDFSTDSFGLETGFGQGEPDIDTLTGSQVSQHGIFGESNDSLRFLETDGQINGSFNEGLIGGQVNDFINNNSTTFNQRLSITDEPNQSESPTIVLGDGIPDVSFEEISVVGNLPENIDLEGENPDSSDLSIFEIDEIKNTFSEGISSLRDFTLDFRNRLSNYLLEVSSPVRNLFTNDQSTEKTPEPFNNSNPATGVPDSRSQLFAIDNPSAMPKEIGSQNC